MRIACAAEVAKAKNQNLLQRTGRILSERTKGKNMQYPPHAPKLECAKKAKPERNTNME